jgi:hypothetical protein
MQNSGAIQGIFVSQNIKFSGERYISVASMKYNNNNNNNNSMQFFIIYVLSQQL